MTFGTMLKAAREDLDVSVRDVSHVLEMTTSMLWRYEQDQAVPSLTNALKLAAYYGLSLDVLKDAVILPGEEL